MDTPPISVIISTRNRGDSIISTIKSILSNHYPEFDLHIVDQSDNDLTERAVQPFLNEPNLHFYRSKTRGSAAGRNFGITNSHNGLIAITDDDCVVPSNWLSEMAKALQYDPKIGAVFGNVLPGEHDPKEGFIPTYVRKEPFLARDVNEKNKVRGIGACIGLRRSVWQAVHHFDELLGTGARLKCSEEGDFAIKVLMSGYYIYETPELSLIHNGFRTWEQGRSMSERSFYGVGATLAKYFKARKLFVLPMIGYEWGYIAVRQFLRNLIYKRRVSGLTPIIAFWHGFFGGLLTPVDWKTGNFVNK